MKRKFLRFSLSAGLCFCLLPYLSFSYDVCIKGPAGYQNTVDENYQFPDDFDFNQTCDKACRHLSIQTVRHVIAVKVPEETKLGDNAELEGKEFSDSKRTHFGTWDGTRGNAYSTMKQVVDAQCGKNKGYGVICSCDIKTS